MDMEGVLSLKSSESASVETGVREPVGICLGFFNS